MLDIPPDSTSKIIKIIRPKTPTNPSVPLKKIQKPKPEPIRLPSPKAIRIPTPKPIRKPTPKPIREPTLQLPDFDLELNYQENRNTYKEFLKLTELYKEYLIEKCKKEEENRNTNTNKNKKNEAIAQKPKNRLFSFFDFLKEKFSKKKGTKTTIIVEENGNEIEMSDSRFLSKEFEVYVDFIQRREEQLTEFNKFLDERLSDVTSLRSENIELEVLTEKKQQAFKRKNLKELKKKHDIINKELMKKKEYFDYDFELDLK